MGLYGNMSDTNSEISASESVANNMTNIVKIYEQDEDDIKTVNFIDFLGVGATWKLNISGILRVFYFILLHNIY